MSSHAEEFGRRMVEALKAASNREVIAAAQGRTDSQATKPRPPERQDASFSEND